MGRKGWPLKPCKKCSEVRPLRSDGLCMTCRGGRSLWTAEQDAHLRSLWYALGWAKVSDTVNRIARLTGRTNAAVLSRAVYRGFPGCCDATKKTE